MSNKKTQASLLLGILTITAWLSYLTPVLENSIEEYNNFEVTPPNQLQSANYWNNFTYIHITGSNWSVVEGYDWCQGSGTWNDPYIIENITVNATDSPSGTGIRIDNSQNDYFIIRNCTILNSSTSSFGGGIFLFNTNNGTIFNNTFYDNLEGICLRQSNNNTIIENKIYNGSWGIEIFGGNDNNVSKNEIDLSSGIGIFLVMVPPIWNSVNNSFAENSLTQCRFSIAPAFSVTISDLLSNIISDNNTINSKPFYYYVNKSNLDSNNFTNAGQIILFYVNDSIISKANILNITGGISCSYSKNITIIDSNFSEGFGLSNSYNCNIYNNSFLDCSDNGLSFSSCYNTSIVNNIINGGDQGISLRSNSYNNSIINNTLNNCEESGIWLDDSYNNTVYNNTMTDCGFMIEGTTKETHSNVVAQNNTINGRPVYYYEDEINLNENNFSNAGKVLLLNVNNSVIVNLNISGIWDGISVFYSYNNSFETNNLSYNKNYGMNIFNSGFNNVSNNFFLNNTQYGLVVNVDSHNNTIFNNTFNNNGNENAWGIGDYNDWDNGSIGNYWDDYDGKDADDNGIGDPGYPYDVYGLAGSKDNYPIFWDAPVILIISPANDTVFGNESPTFKVSIDEGLNHTIWYRVSTNPQIYTFSSSSVKIDSDAWYWFGMMGDVNFTFYVNDSRGYLGSIDAVIFKDPLPPFIFINEPSNNSVFGENAPTFNVTIAEWNPNETWYEVGANTTKHFISSNSTGTINQTAWSQCSDGNVNITFYSNDTVGNNASKMIILIKDTIAPNITIITPPSNQNVELGAPTFSLNITELTINATWYRIWNGAEWTDNYTFSGSSGTINQTIWTVVWSPLAHEDAIIIQFFVNDSIGREANATVQVKKYAPPSTNGNGTPPTDIPDLVVIIIIVGALGGVIAVIVVFIKKGSGKEAGNLSL